MHDVSIEYSKCVYCRTCLSICPWGVYEDVGGRVEVSRVDQCVACNSCIAACPADAITVREDPEFLNK